MILDKLPNVFFITKLTFGRFFMRKKIVSLFLVLVLTMSFGSVAFASTEIIDDPGIDTHDTDTVSYTHLDVYKRQAFCSATFSASSLTSEQITLVLPQLLAMDMPMAPLPQQRSKTSLMA